ncbi:MAG: ankyrin repeat domain-containing protein, partial [Planctomycetaceae bacterium]
MILMSRKMMWSMLACVAVATMAGCKDSSKSSTSQPAAQTGQPSGTAQSKPATGGQAGETGKPDTAAIIKALDSASPAPIQQAIAAGMDVSSPLHGLPYTPLDYAISKRRGAVAKVLIEKGADLSFRDKSGATYLHRAAAMSMPDVVDALLRKGADIAATNQLGQTALHKACIADSLPCVELLTDRQTDMNVKTKAGDTPLQCTESAEVAAYLLAKGADPNVADGDGMTVLHTACDRNSLEMVKTLVEHHADVNA